MTYSEPVRNQKPNRLGTGNRTEPNRFLNYIPRNRTEPNREPEIHQFLETETEPNRTDPKRCKHVQKLGELNDEQWQKEMIF